jgi:ssDNA-binding Zn-finger/Zn-ribbon topoisomerase 1
MSPLEKELEIRTDMQCPECGANRVRRMQRVGFLQNTVFPFFGYYPWECTLCREPFLAKKRYKRKSKKSKGVGEEAPE